MSVEDRVRKLIEDGRAEGAREHDAIRANVEADKPDEPTAGWGRVEEISRESDLVRIEGWAEGIEAAVLEVARAVDALRAEGTLGSG